MNSDALTGTACSSNSARPVFRRKDRILGICLSLDSTFWAASWDFCSEVPGGRTTLICTVPSSKGGRKSLSNRTTATALAMTAKRAMPRTGIGARRLTQITRPASALRLPSSKLSCSLSERRSAPNISSHKSGAKARLADRRSQTERVDHQAAADDHPRREKTDGMPQ